MMIRKIDHIGIVVKNLNDALDMYRRAYGLEAKEIKTYEEVKATIAIIPLGEGEIHLITPTEQGLGVIGRFLEEKGEGIHHIGLRVENIEHTMARLENSDTPCLDKKPMEVGGLRVAFTNQSFTQNVLYELLEKANSPPRKEMKP